MRGPGTGRWRTRHRAYGGRPRARPTPVPRADSNVSLTRWHPRRDCVRVEEAAGAAVIFELVDDGRCLAIGYEGDSVGDVRVLDDALAVTAAEEGYAVVPCREGLLIPATSGVAFSQTFGTSDYEGCHMNMIGLVKRGSAGGELGRRLRVRRAEEHVAG